MDLTQYYSRKEVMELLNVSGMTLHKWGVAGKIKMYKNKNLSLYLKSEVDGIKKFVLNTKK
jgi:predicted site-specific integrase-resolvase